MGLSLPDLTREQKRDDQATEVSVLSFEKAGRRRSALPGV
jgi:hypothetical protein